jgi:hypothetical protein
MAKQVGYRLNTSLDKVLEELTELQSNLPRFKSYVNLYASHSGLSCSLRNLYKDYIDFCVIFIKWMARGP